MAPKGLGMPHNSTINLPKAPSERTELTAPSLRGEASSKSTLRKVDLAANLKMGLTKIQTQSTFS